MRMSGPQLELNREFAGIADIPALDAEIVGMRAQMTQRTGQLAIERELAEKIHRTRALTILESPALRLVFGFDDSKPRKDKKEFMADEVLSSAFVTNVSSSTLPEGFAESTAKRLRSLAHPDAGNDAEKAKDVDKNLADLGIDPAFSVATGILAAPRSKDKNIGNLRRERYMLHIALTNLKPHFKDSDEAMQNAAVEVEGAPWRVRTVAAFKSLELLMGSRDTWNDFLGSIVESRHIYLINLVNSLQPTIFSLRERLAKGDPVATDALDVDAIDAIFERIWSTLGNKKEDSLIPYRPPYQNWLETLLPAMQMLDPGRKPGVEYTYFESPIRVASRPVVPRHDLYYPNRSEQKLGGNFLDLITSREEPYYKESYDPYKKY